MNLFQRVSRRSFLQSTGALAAAAAAIVPATVSAASGRVIRIGAGKDFRTTFDACARLRSGDVVELDPETYVNGLIGVPKGVNNVTFRGIVGANGQRPVLISVPAPGQPRGPSFPYDRLFGRMVDKGICVIEGDDVTLENIEFTGATSSSSNGAGIRAEGVNLTLRNVFSHHNEMGILSNAVPDSTITIEDSEFSYNRGGPSVDQGHNLYINPCKALIVRGTESHHCYVGHQLKSRARLTDIEGCQFYDGEDGTASFALDISGGILRVVGNYFHKGPNASNPGHMILFYTERDPIGPHEIAISGNVFECLRTDRQGWMFRVMNNAPSMPPISGRIFGNTIYAARGGYDVRPFEVPTEVSIGDNTVVIGPAPKPVQMPANTAPAPL